MGTFSIALGVADECHEAARLLSEQLGEHGIETSIDRLKSVLQTVVADPSRGFLMLARDRSRLVGVAYVAIIMSAEHCGPVAWLEELYVEADARQRRIGTALVISVLDRAQKAGVVAVELEIDASHGRAMSLYQRLGFRRLERSRWVKEVTN
jgi:GNAT superfamily N-acetyltransferase